MWLGLVTAAFGVSLVHAAEVLPDVQRFHRYSPTLAISGQPQRGQFSEIANAGYRTVVNVASPDSNPYAIREEKQLVEAAGMAYHHIPLSWEKPDPVQVAHAAKLLRQLEGSPTLVHCYVGSRASLVAYLYRVAYAGAAEFEERATLTQLWNLNRGYEFQNSPQWQFALEDARAGLGR